MSIIWIIICFYFQIELLYKRTRVTGLGVRIRVPRLLFHHERRFWKDTLQPTRQVTAHVINFPRVLPLPTRPVFVWLIDEDFYAAALAAALFTALFLEKIGFAVGLIGLWVEVLTAIM